MKMVRCGIIKNTFSAKPHLKHDSYMYLTKGNNHRYTYMMGDVVLI